MTPVRWVLLVVAIFVVGSASIVAAMRMPTEDPSVTTGPETNASLPSASSGSGKDASPLVDWAASLTGARAPDPVDLDEGTRVFPSVVEAVVRGATPTVEGFELTTFPDGTTLVAPPPGQDRGWGAYAHRPGGRRVLVEAAHPFTDLGTGRIAAQISVAADARHLLVAGTARTSLDGEGDAAHAPDLPFHAVHLALLTQVDLVIQVHGFASTNHAALEADVVVSAGPGDQGQVAELADLLRRGGLTVCVPDNTGRCDALAGRTNIQGLSAVAAGLPFIHLEISDTARLDPARHSAVVALVSDWIERS